MDEFVVARRLDCSFVQPLGVEFSPFDARDFGADQRRAILEILRAIHRTGPEISLVSRHCLSMRGVRLRTRGLA